MLCFLALIKPSDRNLVDNKGEFFVKCQIDDLHVVVHPSSQKTAACLGTLKQRRNYKKKVDDLNDKRLGQYHKKAEAKGLAVKTKVTAKLPL